MAITRSRVAASWQPWRTWRTKTAERNIDTKNFVPDDALQLAPVTAAVTLLASAAASSEVVVERMGSDRVWQRVYDDLPAWADPERRPNPWQTCGDYLFNLMSNKLVSGNGITRIIDKEWNGWPNQLVSVPWRGVDVSVDGGLPSSTSGSSARAIPGYGGVDR